MSEESAALGDNLPGPRLLCACASSADGGGFDEFLYGRDGHQEQLSLGFLQLFDDGELLSLPGIRRGLALRDKVEDGKAKCS